MKPFRVLFLTAELSPVSGTSPRALAAAALSRALGASHLDLTVVLPRARERDPERFGYARRLEPLRLATDGPLAEVTVFEGKLPSAGGRVFVLDGAEPTRVPAAALELLRQRELWPDVIHIGQGADAMAATLAEIDCGPLSRPAIVSEDTSDIPPGIDEARWQREADPIARKPAAKLELQRAWGLPPRAKAPLVAVHGPFDPSILSYADAAALTALDAQLALFPTDRDERETVTHLRDLASRNPAKVAARVAEDDASVRSVLEAADLVLLPRVPSSQGSSDLYGVRYGAVVIAPAAGEFERALVDFDPRTGTGNGFLFAPDAPEGAVAATRRAVRAFQQRPSEFALLAQRVADMDVSWTTAALRHVDLYRKALAGG